MSYFYLSLEDENKCIKIALALIEAKFQRTLEVLRSLEARYDIADKARRVNREAQSLSNAKTVDEIRMIEGRVALGYWDAYQSIIPECFDFQSRIKKGIRQNNAVDPVNLALNYAYGVIEGECRRAINSVGLEPSIGFLHEFSGYQTKQSLVYDLQEPFRWIGDVTVLEAIESRALDLKDFYFSGDDYRYRFEVEAKRRFLGLLRNRFNSGVEYKGARCKWDTVIQIKTQELGRFLSGKKEELDFRDPAPLLSRTDSQEARDRILTITQSEASKLGISKSTLHYLRKNAKNRNSFKIYSKVAQRLGQTELSPKSPLS